MSGAQASANGGLRFLIVDDSRSAASVMTALLSRYAVCQKAFDGVEGLKAFQKSVEHDDAFDLICLDIMMPRWMGSPFSEGFAESRASAAWTRSRS